MRATLTCSSLRRGGKRSGVTGGAGGIRRSVTAERGRIRTGRRPKMTYVLLGIVVLVVLYVVYLYNNLIVLRNRIDNAWSQIDVQLRRRYDLIPNLVETVKGYATHEREVFERVTQARSRAIAAGSVGEQSQAENMLNQALRSLFAVAENYPQLRATANFPQLEG